ncbi:hypothetical protein F01_200214 [Burkholderia cenocepacia]|nr:hypothetical protein F01_200214 [Burkholderia cenocepacia]
MGVGAGRHDVRANRPRGTDRRVFRHARRRRPPVRLSARGIGCEPLCDRRLAARRAGGREGRAPVGDQSCDQHGRVRCGVRGDRPCASPRREGQLRHEPAPEAVAAAARSRGDARGAAPDRHLPAELGRRHGAHGRERSRRDRRRDARTRAAGRRAETRQGRRVCRDAERAARRAGLRGRGRRRDRCGRLLRRRIRRADRRGRRSVRGRALCERGGGAVDDRLRRGRADSASRCGGTPDAGLTRHAQAGAFAAQACAVTQEPGLDPVPSAMSGESEARSNTTWVDIRNGNGRSSPARWSQVSRCRGASPRRQSRRACSRMNRRRRGR